MSTWHRRLFPYPLLAPWTDDYGKGSSFGVEVPEAVLNNGRHIKVGLAFPPALCRPARVDRQ